MAGQPPTAPRSTFSPDGLWWWDGNQWRSALSPDGRWRWDGRSWVPTYQGAPPRAPGGAGAGTAVAITIVAFVGVLFLVGLLTVVVLLTMGNQLTNVFSNVADALGSSPSP
jgi:hypothetical protein